MSSQQIPFIPYGRQTVTDSDIDAVVNVLRGPFLTQGPAVPAFEKSVAQKVGASFGVATNSATSALHVACLALGLGPDDWLWTSPITFVASANCGRYCGARVDFVDIDPTTGLMSVEALSLKLEKSKLDGTLPKVVVPVHLAGSSCDMAEIAELSERYGFAVVEDASHAIGGSYRDAPVGNCRYSSITIFSFHPVKIITTAEGGIAVSNDPALYRKMQEFRCHGIVRDPVRFVSNDDAPPWVYEQQQLGFNYRMTDIQAALGLSQIQRLDEIVRQRNFQLQNYRLLLSGLNVKLLSVPNSVVSAVHLAIIRLQDAIAYKHREVFEGLRAAGFGVQLHYTPVHLQPYYRKFGFQEGDFPYSEIYAQTAISLPLFPGLEVADQHRVVSILSRLLAE